MGATLILQDGSQFAGEPFGFNRSVAGEVVFNTGMVGYPETLTDPSYEGQILTLTYPLIGNYGVPDDETRTGLPQHFESTRIHVAGLIVSECSPTWSHWSAVRSLDAWLRSQRVPGLMAVDTRALTKKLRESGTMLGKLVQPGEDVPWRDPNREDLGALVSRTAPQQYGQGAKHVALIDCGCKNEILRSLLSRNLAVTVLPLNHTVEPGHFDGILVSNGPGDLEKYAATIATVRTLLHHDKPLFGICLGHQLLALAAGARTRKLKYGHRSQNQPCLLVGSQRCFMTAQNHGYAVDEKSLPSGWTSWFFNANDGTNEGIRHADKPFRSVQFHPEATPGPTDTAYLFDEFLGLL
jgi:carbamoyl-phosphate synthase small subunit